MFAGQSPAKAIDKILSSRSMQTLNEEFEFEITVYFKYRYHTRQRILHFLTDRKYIFQTLEVGLFTILGLPVTTFYLQI